MKIYIPLILHIPPLTSSEMDRYLLEFRGGTFPLSAIGSYKGSGGGGGRKGRDSSKLRRSNTSPRKKGSPAWSCGGSFREGKTAADGSDTSCMKSQFCLHQTGTNLRNTTHFKHYMHDKILAELSVMFMFVISGSLSTTDVSFISNGKVQRFVLCLVITTTMQC